MKPNPGEKQSSRQSDENSPPGKRRWRSVWLWMGISFLGTGLMIALLVVFPRWTHQEKFVSVELIEWNGKPLLVSLYLEYSYSEDDGDCLKGVVVKTHEPASGDELGNIFLPHEAKGMPSGGQLLLLEDGIIWVNCSNNGNMFLNMGTLLAKLQLGADGSLIQLPVPIPSGLTPAGTFLHGRVGMVNQYQEVFCYELRTGETKPGGCLWEQRPVAQAAFFQAKKEAGSTRSRLWYVRSSDKIPEPTISMGFVSGDRPLDGVNLFNDLNSNNYNVTEERLAYYQTMGDSGEFKFLPISDDYLVHALISHQDSTCAILQLPGSEEGKARFACYFPDGRQGWEVELDLGDNLYLAFEPHWTDDQVILVSKEAMAVGVSSSTGKVLWEWRP